MKSITTLFFIFSIVNAQKVSDSARPIEDPGPVDPIDPIICPENELLVPCGSFCPDGCSDNELIKCPIRPGPIPCQTCTCLFGYRRNSNGVCVPKEECDEICPDANAEYLKCKRCVPSCDEPNIICTKECNPAGCYCKEGYVRRSSSDPTCIPKEKCPPNECEGDPNAVPTPCSSSCPLTCENFQKPPIICTTVCSKSPCECKPGYVLDNGKCVLPTECPFIPPCPENQTMNWCPRPCPPEQTCKEYISGLIRDCPPPSVDETLTIFCKPTCNCRDGYIRRYPGGDCILPNDCCDDPNAEIVSCVNPCPGGTCERPAFEQCQFLFCKPGCQCKRGYIKNSLGKCVLPTSCPRPLCGKNEIWNPFPNLCQRDRTCTSILQRSDVIFGIRPIGGRCECLPGFVRINGTCLPENLCCTLNDPNSVIADCPTVCDCTCWICPIPECRVPCHEKGCICRPGYVRNNDGKCIHPRLCRWPFEPIEAQPLDV